jgi:hypothetical protein
MYNLFLSNYSELKRISCHHGQAAFFNHHVALWNEKKRAYDLEISTNWIDGPNTEWRLLQVQTMVCHCHQSQLPFTMERNQLSCARCNIFLARVQDDAVHQLLSSPPCLPHSHNPTCPSAAILFRAGSSRCLVPPTSSPLIATHMTTCPGPVLKCS